MGCCESTNLAMQGDVMISRIKNAISLGDIKQLMYFLCKPGNDFSLKLDLNDFTFQAGDGLITNIPGYCVLCGRADLFRSLNEKYCISIPKLEKHFSIMGASALAIICSKGYDQLLQYYLPLSLSVDPTSYHSISNATLNLSAKANFSVDNIFRSTYSPIHLAAFCGFINCIKVSQEFFQDNVPWWMDINYKDVTTGENCALLACKGACFPMIKYLHRFSAADFKVLNAVNENALQIFLISCKYCKVSDSLKIVKYLVESIGIDISESIEETLLVCNSKETSQYLEEKCKEKGLDFKKTEVETRYKITSSRPVEEADYKSISIDMSHPSSISSVRYSEISNFGSVVNQIE